MTEHIEVRCSDCLARRDDAVDDARWLYAAGATRSSPAVVEDVALAFMWNEVAAIHDEGAK